MIWAGLYIFFDKIVAPVALIEWFVYNRERLHNLLIVDMNDCSVCSPNADLQNQITRSSVKLGRGFCHRRSQSGCRWDRYRSKLATGQYGDP
ncbi:hypothetical protein DPMN_186315 [Dreissena polymorpha]|uniref:Uncharacterized protein n=1 Tax=Dreissena polymorpha TaxID=45954 RepID=A0A9D4DM28_DREPO|nr:hypothetical protein DPMN_186315 [Dreissena polymorpha]